jgi:SAM-dependent methyltransferase
MKAIIAFLIRYVPRKYLQRVSGVGMKLLAVLYSGKGVVCPICGSNFRKFLPYGRINPRQNALCPNCLSLERHRLIWLYLRDETDVLNRRQYVLHIAPEACFMKRLEAIHGDQYITADIESPLAKIKADIHQLPFGNNTFNVVLCNHVLEHVRDDIGAVRELTRVLKRDGFAILQVPFFRPIEDTTYENSAITSPRDRERIFGQADHVRKYGHDYPIRLRRGGLTPIESDFVDRLSEEDRKKYGLVKGEIIYGGTKGEYASPS